MRDYEINNYHIKRVFSYMAVREYVKRTLRFDWIVGNNPEHRRNDDGLKGEGRDSPSTKMPGAFLCRTSLYATCFASQPSAVLICSNKSWWTSLAMVAKRPQIFAPAKSAFFTSL